MENLEDSEHHGAEEVIYESDEVHVVLDTFAGETQVPDSLSAADVETVAVAESEVDVAHALMLLAKTKVNTFQADEEARYVANLMIPLLVPCLYIIRTMNGTTNEHQYLHQSTPSHNRVHVQALPTRQFLPSLWEARH
jgi:hypothetical protein